MPRTALYFLFAALAGALLFALPERTLRIEGGNPPELSGEDIRKDPPATAIFTGDVMLGRYVRTLMEAEGTDYPFRKIGGFLREADAVVANLEGPIVADAPVTPIQSLTFAFVPETAKLLREQNVRIVSLGNNHALDQGQAGFDDTKRILGEAGIASMGNPLRVNENSFLETGLGGKRIALLGVNATWPSFDEAAAVAAVRTRAESGDFLIVGIHWGEEYRLVAGAREERLARELIDAGADMIWGHHPHVVQNIEVYRNRAIFYSLGNFVFDQYFSKETQEGLLVKAEVADEEVRYSLFPVALPRSQPALMEGGERARFLAALAARSQPDLQARIQEGSFSLTRE